MAEEAVTLRKMARKPKQPPNPAAVNELIIGVDGDGVTPEHLDVLPSLAFFHAFVRLLQALAKAQDSVLVFTGMRVHRGSAGLALSTESIHLAEATAHRANLYLAGVETPPRGLQTQVAEVRESLMQLRGVAPFFQAGKRREQLPTTFEVERTLVEFTEYRGIVHRVGGSTPRVVLVVIDNGLELNLRTSQAIAQDAAQSLYRVIDAAVSITWHGDKVVDSELQGFTPVDDLTAEVEIERWRRWFAVGGSAWDDVEDIERNVRGDVE